jgi:tetratricopeptide (TPR) repeat protein
LVHWIERNGNVIPKLPPANLKTDAERALAELCFGSSWKATSLFDALISNSGETGALVLLKAMATEEWYPEDARELYARAQKILPEDPDPSYRIAMSLYKEARLGEALQAARKAIAIEANHADLQLLLGKILADMGDVGLAKRAFHNVLQLRPDDAHAQSEVKRLDGTR